MVRVIAFRVDASLDIGSGHIMRCITLANALREQGAECHFLCRAHPGHYIDVLKGEGFVVHRLGDYSGEIKGGLLESTSLRREHKLPEHADWLGTAPAIDAAESLDFLFELQPDWLVIDHYALDAEWQVAIREALPALQLMVIDDLADRPHQVDLLLDQNLGRLATDYQGLVPEGCRLLVGPTYALLRNEFAEWRSDSLSRRQGKQSLKHLMVSLGGVDQHNVTLKVLDVLRLLPLPERLRISVIMGATAPWLEQVKELAASMPRPTEVVINAKDMAQRMSEADLAIGGGGSTSWERCCLGLPTLLLVMAENQEPIAEALHQAGIAYNLGYPNSLIVLQDQWTSLTEISQLAEMSAIAAQVVDGYGVARVVGAMEEASTQWNPYS